MAGHIGVLGRMIPLLWADPAQVKAPTRYEVQTAPARRWAFVSTPASARRREWSLEMSGTQREMAPVLQLAAGYLGDGPFWLVTEEAALCNVLTPGMSMLEGVANAGPVDTVDGMSAVSVVGGSQVLLARRVPVIPGQPVTVSVDASGDTALSVQCVDAAGGAVGAAYTGRASGTRMQRVRVLIPDVPAGVAAINIRAAGYVSLACPQVVWSEEPAPWDIGQGSDSVIVEESTMTHTVFEPGMRDWWRGLSLTLKEVG